MRMFVFSLLATAMLGCGVKEDASNQNAAKPKGRSPGGLPGMVLPDQDDAPVGGGNQAQPAPANNKTIPDVEARLVEWPKAKQETPGLEVVDNKAQGGDPLSFAASAYVTLASRAEVTNFKHNLDIMKAANEDRPVSFQQFKDLAKQCRIQFQNQPAYRYYGYDTQTGDIVVLEDKAEKKRIYKEKGIPYEE